MGKVALAVIVSLWVIPISMLVNHIVPEPYMVSKVFECWRDDWLWMFMYELRKLACLTI